MRNFKKFLALVLSVMMVFGTMASLLTVGASAVDSKDIDTAINFLKALNIMQGYEDGSDGRDDPVTREAAAIFFARIRTGYIDNVYWTGKTNTTPFTDISKSEFIGAINAVYQLGIINGATTVEGIKIFNPSGKITYQDMLVMAVRALGYNTKDSDGNEIMGYPWGYIGEATRLGLTENMDGVGFEEELTRGETAIILYNALNTVLNGSTVTLLSSVFKVTESTYVLVSTENQTMNGYNANFAKSNRTGYVGLAELNTTGTINTNNTIFVTAESLGLSASANTANSADNALGHSFKVLKKSDGTVLGATKNPTKTVRNYGENSAIQFFTSTGNYIKIDGVTYTLATSITDNNDTLNYPGIIIYDSSYGDATISAANTGLTAYSVMTVAKDLYMNQFCEVTLIDDKGDGKYSRAVFTPFYVDKYRQSSSANQTAYNVSTGLTYGSSNQSTGQLATLDNTGVNITAYVSGSESQRRNIRQADIIFVNDTYGSASRPTNYYYVVYTYNPYTRVFRIIENLGAIKTGTITDLNRITDSTANSRNSTIKIDGIDYGVGYLDLQYKRTATVTSEKAVSHTISIPGEVSATGVIQPTSGNYYWDENITKLLSASTFQISYVALAGRLIIANSVSATPTVPDYASFDISKDLVGVDFEGNLIINAYTDATGVKKQIKVNTINGISIGQYIINSYGLVYTSTSSGAYYSINDTLRASMMGDRVIAAYFPETDYVYNVSTKNLTTNVFTLTGKTDSNPIPVSGVYTTAKTVTFPDGITNIPFTSDSSRVPVVLTERFQTNAATVYMIVGSNGIEVYKGLATSSDWISIALTTKIISANSSFVMVVDKSRTTTEISSFKGDGSGVTISDSYYIFKDNTSLVGIDLADGKIVYTYNNVYNINERANQNGINSTVLIENWRNGSIYARLNGTFVLYAEIPASTNYVGTAGTSYLAKLDSLMGGLGYDNTNVIVSKAGENSPVVISNRSDITTSGYDSSKLYVFGYNSLSVIWFNSAFRQQTAWSTTSTSVNTSLNYYKIDSAGAVVGYSFVEAYAILVANGGTGTGTGTLAAEKTVAINNLRTKYAAYTSYDIVNTYLNQAATAINLATTQAAIDSAVSLYTQMIDLAIGGISNIDVAKAAAKARLGNLTTGGYLISIVDGSSTPVGYQTGGEKAAMGADTTVAAAILQGQLLVDTAISTADLAVKVETAERYINEALLKLEKAAAKKAIETKYIIARQADAGKTNSTITGNAAVVAALAVANTAIDDVTLALTGNGNIVATVLKLDIADNGSVVTTAMQLNILRAVTAVEVDIVVAGIGTPSGYTLDTLYENKLYSAINYAGGAIYTLAANVKNSINSVTSADNSGMGTAITNARDFVTGTLTTGITNAFASGDLADVLANGKLKALEALTTHKDTFVTTGTSAKYFFGGTTLKADIGVATINGSTNIATLNTNLTAAKKAVTDSARTIDGSVANKGATTQTAKFNAVAKNNTVTFELSEEVVFDSSNTFSAGTATLYQGTYVAGNEAALKKIGTAGDIIVTGFDAAVTRTAQTATAGVKYVATFTYTNIFGTAGTAYNLTSGQAYTLFVELVDSTGVGGSILFTFIAP